MFGPQVHVGERQILERRGDSRVPEDAQHGGMSAFARTSMVAAWYRNRRGNPNSSPMRRKTVRMDGEVSQNSEPGSSPAP